MFSFLKGDIKRDILAYDSEGKAIRKKITNKEDYISFVKEYNGKRNIAVQVNPDLNIELGFYDTIFLDFDNNGNIEAVFEEVKRVYELLGSGRLYFSGKKGFHIYLDIESVYLGDKYRRVMVKWGKSLNTKYLDLQCLMDKRRMARVVYTVNISSGAYMIPISADESLSQIISRSLNPNEDVFVHEIKENKDVSEQLRKIYLEDEEEKTKTVKKISKISVTEAEMPPCVRKSIEILRATGELDHFYRFHLANYLIQMGYSEQEIEKIFERYAKDYDDAKTSYQVEYLKGRDMKPFNCANAIALGICPLEEPKLCPYYPSINLFLKMLRGD